MWLTCFLTLWFNQFIFVAYDFATIRGELKIRPIITDLCSLAPKSRKNPGRLRTGGKGQKSQTAGKQCVFTLSSAAKLGKLVSRQQNPLKPFRYVGRAS